MFSLVLSDHSLDSVSIESFELGKQSSQIDVKIVKYVNTFVLP